MVVNLRFNSKQQLFVSHTLTLVLICRRIGTVIMERDPGGRLGVKIGGTPSGVYVDKIDWGVARLLQGSLQVMIPGKTDGNTVTS